MCGMNLYVSVDIAMPGLAQVMMVYGFTTGLKVAAK